MEAAQWRRVFESIRGSDQKCLVIRTADALEVAVEDVSRIEEDVLLVRGRIAGTADARRVFILPYDKLSSVFVNRVVASEEVDLFSPSISAEEKDRIARDFEEKSRRAKEDELNQARGGQPADNQGDIKSQIEELRRMANLGAPPTSSEPLKPSMTPTPAAVGTQARPALPGPSKQPARLTLPDRPRR